MNPVLTLVMMGGNLLLLSAFVWLLYRLGGFRPTARERRNWVLIGAVLIAWVVLLAFIGPMPMPLPLFVFAGSVASAVWLWRTRRSLDHVPIDLREEAAQRREWMRSHVGLLVGLGIAFTLSMVAWAIAVVILTRPA